MAMTPLVPVRHKTPESCGDWARKGLLDVSLALDVNAGIFLPFFAGL